MRFNTALRSVFQTRYLSEYLCLAPDRFVSKSASCFSNDDVVWPDPECGVMRLWILRWSEMICWRESLETNREKMKGWEGGEREKGRGRENG